MILTKKMSAEGYYGYGTKVKDTGRTVYGITPDKFDKLVMNYVASRSLLDNIVGSQTGRVISVADLQNWLNETKISIDELESAIDTDNSGKYDWIIDILRKTDSQDAVISSDIILQMLNDNKIDTSSSNDFLGYIFNGGYGGMNSSSMESMINVDDLIEIPKDAEIAIFAFEYHELTDTFWALCSYSYQGTYMETHYVIKDKNGHIDSVNSPAGILSPEELEELEAKGYQIIETDRPTTGIVNEFMYIPVNDIDMDPLTYKLPREILEMSNDIQVELPNIDANFTFETPYGSYNKVHGLEAHEALGEVWISTETSYLYTANQVLLNSCELTSNKEIAENRSDTFCGSIPQDTIVSVLVNQDGQPIAVNTSPSAYGEEPAADNQYLVIIYKGICRYVNRKNFHKNADTISPILKEYNEGKQAHTGYPATSVEQVQLKKNSSGNNALVCYLNPEQALTYPGSNELAIAQKNFTRVISGPVYVAGYEMIRDYKFLLVWGMNPTSTVQILGTNHGIGPDCFTSGYIPYDMLLSNLDNPTDELFTYWIGNDSGGGGPQDSTGVEYEPVIPDWDYIENTNDYKYWDEYDPDYSTGPHITLGEEGLYGNITPSRWSQTESETSKKDSRKEEPFKWYDVTLEAGIYPNDEDDYNEIVGTNSLENRGDTRLPSQWADTDLLGWDLYHSLQRYSMMYLPDVEGGHADERHINKINRFKFITDMSGLSTKSFIFMTKPDLNIFDRDENGAIINNKMNPDLRRIPEFKYIGRNKDIGWNIIDSLEYWPTNSGHTPWLSIITNQAQGYTPIDRELGYTEVGETFHGHRVLYGKHDFKHNIAGTVSIPFMERRDLSLYYTLKFWTEYIHCINLGFVSPNEIHIQNAELDYAVSLFYIQTDETMENILYWEKLTGVFPLKCPDSFFEWTKGSPGKSMEYTIDFAYSMRSVLRSTDLFEINRLYMKGADIKEETVYPQFKDFINDDIDNRYIAKMVAYFGNEKTDTIDIYDDKGNVIKTKEYEEGTTGLVVHMNDRNWEPESDEYNNFVNRLLDGTEDISRYYYEPYADANGNVNQFLANYVPEIQSHGVPYVKGPFIVPHRYYNGGKFLLKWV